MPYTFDTLTIDQISFLSEELKQTCKNKQYVITELTDTFGDHEHIKTLSVKLDAYVHLVCMLDYAKLERQKLETINAG